ncbi:MAG: hypothetical protein GXP40_09230 [Chloroflexi bacterium]|nr:hypothetical protein [Chloroflexota bacterium]
MKRVFAGLFLLLIFAVPRPVVAQGDGSAIAITSPRDGEVLQGAVAITGTSAVDGFLSAEIAFAYAGDTTGTWFLIRSSDQPVRDDVLATWDTTTLTDGVYTLRLRVTMRDGAQLDVTTAALRVRNYTPIETPTLVPTTPTAPIDTTATPRPAAATATPYATPTLLPPNDAAITTGEITASLGRGALTIIILFTLFGIILRLRRD